MEKIERYYYPSGKIKRELYYQNGQLHREDGPAYIFYNESGNIKIEEYWLNDKKITDPLQIAIMKGLSLNN